MASLAQINIRFKADLKGFSTEMQNSMRTLQTVGTKMNNIGKSMSTYITGPLLLAGGAAIKFASDYNESVNKVEVAFGPASTAVKEFAKTSLESFGIAEGSALDAAAQFGDMGTSMGLPQTAAAKMSTSLVGLAGDLASFKNIGIEQANTALAGVFTGETESLKKLGIVMTEANLQAFALSQGIKVQYKDMDQASRVNLRYAYIMENTTNAQGDFARTGGGAANQMRIFQESLKQLAQQFGSVILPTFTKVITYVNGMIQGFSNLDPVARGIIIGIAGIAAAIGPLMSGLGNVIGLIPKMIIQFNALKATMLANPYTAAALGIAALAVGIYAFVQANKDAATTQETLNAAVKKGNENAASEIGILDKLYTTATSVNVPIKDRKKAVDDLQALYPAYFKNIKDEIILNGTSKTAYEQLRDAIFNKSRAIAIDGEIQSRANERVKEEVALREKIALTESRIAEIKKGGNTIVLQEGSLSRGTLESTITKTQALKDQNDILKQQRNNLTNFTAKAKKDDEALFKAKDEYSKKSSKLQENEVQKLGEIKTGVDAVTESNGKLIKVGTIEWYNEKIDLLQKEQTAVATTSTAYGDLQNQIDAYAKKVEAIKNPEVKLPEFVKPTETSFDVGELQNPSLDNLKGDLAYFESKRGELSKTSDEYKTFADVINSLQFKIAEIEGTEENITKLDGFKEAFTDTATELVDVSSAFQESLQSFAQSTFETLGTVLGQIATGTGGVDTLFKGLLGVVGSFMTQLGKSLIQVGVASAAFKKAFANPFVAIAAGVALIALGSIVQSQLQAGPGNAGAFANGGVVGGTSYSGDRLFARVNSGEMILNQKQQRNLSGMISPAVSAGDVAISLMGGFEIEGAKLRLVLDRTDKIKNRVG
jgi:hypothetical protein